MKCESHPRTCGLLSSAPLMHSSPNFLFQPPPATCILRFEIKGSGIMAKAESPRYGWGLPASLALAAAEEGVRRKGRENWGGRRACSIQEPKCLAFPLPDVGAANLVRGKV